MTPGQRELHRARAYLNRVAEPPAPALSELITEVGPVQAARLVAAGQVPDRVAAETAARRGDNRAEADLSAIAALGGRLVVPEDDEWPAEAFTCFETPTAHADEQRWPLRRMTLALSPAPYPKAEAATTSRWAAWTRVASSVRPAGVPRNTRYLEVESALARRPDTAREPPALGTPLIHNRPVIHRSGCATSTALL